MNFLAHAHLGRHDEDLLVGQILGDFLEPGWRAKLPPGVARGVALHHDVDRFTDGHPLFGESRRRLGPRFRLYAGVLVDVFYDHFLARNWSRYHPERPLRAFTREVYAALERRRDVWTDRFTPVFPLMSSHDWLGSYGDLGAIDIVLAGIGRRLRRPSPLPEGGQALRDSYAALEDDFHRFFPELEAFVRTRKP